VLLDLSYRIMRYERAFPEVADQIQRADSDRGLSCFSLQYWTFLVYRPLLVLYCLPEIHFLCSLWFSIAYMLPQCQCRKRKGDDDFWMQVQKAITIERLPSHGLWTQSWFCCICNFCMDRIVYKKEKLYDSLEEWSRSLIMLVNRTPLWFLPEAEASSSHELGEHSSSLGVLYRRECWDWLICRLEELKAAKTRIKVLVEIRETDPKKNGQQQSSL
jgi:hypothetical protein